MINVDIEYDKGNDLLIHRIDDETLELREHIEKVSSFMEYIERFQPYRVLIHGPWNNLRFDMQLKGWIDNVLLPQVSKTRVRKIAFLIDNLPEELLNLVDVQNQKLSIRIFVNQKDALLWLISE
jgi:hypothetical protein